jgi:hypothetical protein
MKERDGMSRQPDGAGKGDAPRPLGVDMDAFDSNWDAIFNKEKDKAQPNLSIDIEASNDEQKITVTKTWEI